MSNHIHSSPDDIDPVEILTAIKRGALKLLLASLVVGVCTFLVLSMMTPRFTSVAELQFGGRAVVDNRAMNRQGQSGQQDLLQRVDKEAVASQVAVIKSRDLALKLIQELDLRNNRNFNTALAKNGIMAGMMRILGMGETSNGGLDDQLLTKYDSSLKVYQGKDTRVVSVQFSAATGELAARAANRLAELYLASRAKQGVKQSVDASKWLKPEIEKLQQEVQTAEAKVEEFRASNNLFATSIGSQRGSLNNEQLAELTRELTRAKGLQSEAEARAKGIHELMQRGSADASPDVLRSPLMQRLQDQRVRVERQLSELSATLLGGHPRMRQLRADLNGLQRQIRSEVGKIVDSVSKEAKVAALRVASVQASIDVLKSQVRNSGGDQAKLNELEREAKAKRQELESMQARFQAARARQQASAVPLEAELFSKARASTIPTFPKKGPITLLAMAGTFLMGLAFIVTKSLLLGSRSGGAPQGGGRGGRRATDHRGSYATEPALAGSAPQAAAATTAATAGAAAAASMPAPAPVPAPAPAPVAAAPAPVAAPAPAAAAPVAASPAPAAATHAPAAKAAPLPIVETIERFAEVETVDSAVQQLSAHAKGQGGFRTLIAGEGSSIDAGDEAIDAAIALARTGRQVVLVDWSLSGKGIAPRLRLKAEPGMTDLLAGTASFEDVISALPGSDVHFIGAGTAPAKADPTTDGDRLNLVLDALDEAYDHIIVHGQHEEARELFEAIQGRFDAGLVVAEAQRRVSVLQDAPGTFLGFEVSDLQIIRLERGAAGKTSDAGAGFARPKAGSEARV